MAGKPPQRVIALPNEEALPFTVEGDYITFTAPRLETLAMFLVEHE